MFTLTKRETNAQQRTRAVDRLSAWGGTALYDVIIRGVQQLSKQPGRRVLVVFSDGDDRTSHATIHAVEQAVRANDATLFMVALGRGVKEAQLKSGIERLVDLSGGRALFVERSDQLDEPFADILEELSNQYILGYESKNTARNGIVARSEARDSRHQLQRALAPGLSRAGFLACVTSFLAAAVTLAGSVAIAAQQPPAQQPPQVPRPSFETKAEIVLVDVNVVDRDAKPVPTLTAADFDLEVNGQPAPIELGAVHLDRAGEHLARRRRARPPTPRTRAPRPDACCCSSSTKAACASASNRAILRTRAVAVRSARARRPGRRRAAAQRLRRRRVHRRSQARHRCA